MAKYTKSVIKAIDILEAVGSKERPMNLSEISDKLGYSQSTAFRILHTLESRGYLKKINGQYTIGPAILQLKFEAKEDFESELAALSRKFLLELEENTQSTSCLAIRKGLKATPIQIVPGSAKLVVNSNLNEEIPLHATSLGKAILAFMPEKKRDKLLSQLELTPLTDNTVQDEDKLKEELAEIRERGFAIDRGEYSEGVFCVGAPVLGGYQEEGSPLGSVSVSTPNIHSGKQEITRFGQYVVETANKISQKLGLKGGSGS